jgi:hypothetical protein
VSVKAPPYSPLLAGGLDDRAAGDLDQAQDLVDPVGRGHDERQKAAAEAAPPQMRRLRACERLAGQLGPTEVPVPADIAGAVD